jgi:hypothetical protein
LQKGLPSWWSKELILSLVLCSLGVLCLGLAVTLPPRIHYCYVEPPEVSFNGTLEGSLSIATPTINQSLGLCNCIEISPVDTGDDFSPVTLRIINNTDAIHTIIPNYTVASHPLFVSIQLALPVANYTLQALRETQDTFFRCRIYAYVYTPSPPCPMPDMTMNLILLIIGITTLGTGIWMATRLASHTKALFT